MRRERDGRRARDSLAGTNTPALEIHTDLVTLNCFPPQLSNFPHIFAHHHIVSCHSCLFASNFMIFFAIWVSVLSSQATARVCKRRKRAVTLSLAPIHNKTLHAKQPLFAFPLDDDNPFLSISPLGSPSTPTTLLSKDLFSMSVYRDERQERLRKNDNVSDPGREVRNGKDMRRGRAKKQI